MRDRLGPLHALSGELRRHLGCWVPPPTADATLFAAVDHPEEVAEDMSEGGDCGDADQDGDEAYWDRIWRG